MIGRFRGGRRRSAARVLVGFGRGGALGRRGSLRGRVRFRFFGGETFPLALRLAVDAEALREGVVVDLQLGDLVVLKEKESVGSGTWQNVCFYLEVRKCILVKVEASDQVVLKKPFTNSVSKA